MHACNGKNSINANKKIKKMTRNLESVYQHIDSNTSYYVNKLAEAVAIPSVSGDAHHRKFVVEMAEWIQKEMKRLNIYFETRDPGKQILDGKEINLPPVILGRYGQDPKKKTVLVYGHYDVQPALKSDGWATDPFTLVEDDQGRLFGRGMLYLVNFLFTIQGSTDDKGPIISWLWAIELHQKLEMDFPVNLILCFEGMEESGSEGLDDIIFKEAKGFFKDVDCVCISDNYWLGTNKPCLTYGLRGISYFTMEVTGIAKDLHSGVFGKWFIIHCCNEKVVLFMNL